MKERGICFEHMTPLLHLNPQESANFQKHASPGGTLAHSLELSKLFCTLFCLWDVDVLLFVVVKVTCVSRSSALWQERGFDLRTEKETRIFFPDYKLKCVGQRLTFIYVNNVLFKLCLFFALTYPIRQISGCSDKWDADWTKWWRVTNQS